MMRRGHGRRRMTRLGLFLVLVGSGQWVRDRFCRARRMSGQPIPALTVRRPSVVWHSIHQASTRRLVHIGLMVGRSSKSIACETPPTLLPRSALTDRSRPDCDISGSPSLQQALFHRLSSLAVGRRPDRVTTRAWPARSCLTDPRAKPAWRPSCRTSSAWS